MSDDSPAPPPGRLVWRTEDAPCGDALTPEEARAQNTALIKALKRERDLTSDPDLRSRLTVTIRSLIEVQDLRVVEDDERGTTTDKS